MDNASLLNFVKETRVNSNIPKVEGRSAGRADQTKDVRKERRRPVWFCQQQLVHSNRYHIRTGPFFLP